MSIHPTHLYHKTSTAYEAQKYELNKKLKKRRPSSPEPEETYLFKSPKKIDNSEIQKAFQKYSSNLFFHGTSVKSAANIRRKGFKISEKNVGCTQRLKEQTGLDDLHAQSHHYLMGLRSAARYAKMHEQPEIVRVIVPAYIHLEKHPEGHDEDEMRTKDDIPALFVLPNDPEELSSQNIRDINRSLKICMPLDHVEILTKLVAERIISKARQDSKTLESVKSFTEMESERSQDDIRKICFSMGLDPSQLKPGDTFSLSN